MSSSSTETAGRRHDAPDGRLRRRGHRRRVEKQPGDWVEADEIIASISTDKIDTDVESPATGRVQEILVEVGATVEVGTVLARIATDAKPGEPHASEARRRRRSEADVALEAPGEAGELQGDTTAAHAGTAQRGSRRGAALRPAALLAGGDADRRRARHRPRAGRGHRPRRPRAQAGRARVHRAAATARGGRSRRCTSSRPTGPTARRAAQAASRGSAARARRSRARRRHAGRPARSRACASRSAATWRVAATPRRRARRSSRPT